jgi:hypothetical protein
MRRPDARRVVGVLAAVVAIGLLAVAIAGVVLDDPPDAAPASSTTSSGTSSTLPVAPATTGDLTTAPLGPKPTPAPSTEAARAPGPLLDPAQRAWSIYVSDGTVVRRVDLATGQVSELDLAALVHADYSLVGIVAGRLVFSVGNAGGVRSIASDFSGALQTHPIWPAGVYGSVTVAGSRLWAVHFVGDGTPTNVAKFVDLDGHVAAEMTIAQGDYPVGFLGDRALIVRGGRTYTLDGTGTFRVYANGEAIAARNDFVLWVGCDDTARCVYHVGGASDPDLRVTPIPAGRALRTAAQDEGLSPDGQAVVVLTGQAGSRSLVKLATGSETALPSDIDRFAWTPDGEWLVMYGGEQLFALDVRDGRLTSFDLGISNLRSVTFDLVVG